MACGANEYGIAIVATCLSLLVLIGIKELEINFISKVKRINKRLRLSIRCAKCDVNDIQNYIINEFPYINEIKYVDSDGGNSAKIVAFMNVRCNNPIQSLYKDVEKIKGITSISIREADE